MAKRKDDFSFELGPKKSGKESRGEPASESPPVEESATDPSISTDSPTVDSAASTDVPADPFASTETPADPFASTETPTDPFASNDVATAEDVAAADPFASIPDTAASNPLDMPSDPAAEIPEAPAEEETPVDSGVQQHKQFKILILADLSGRTNRGIATPTDLATRKVHNIDGDNFEKIMGKLKPEIHLPVNETSMMPLAFASMDDFRPDALLGRIDAFQSLLTLRSELKDNKQFKAAAEKVRKLMRMSEAPANPAPASPTARGAGDSDFERLLNQPVAPQNAAAIDTDAMIANLVAGYGVPSADPEQKTMIKLVEDAISAGLRAILRHPAFQSLEAAWRGIEFLTTRLSTDEDLKIAVFDISKEELFADLVGPPTIDKTSLFQVLVEQPKIPGTVPYSLVMGDYEFEQDPRDIQLLAKIATLMHEAGLPFLAAATPRVAGFPYFAKFPDSGKWQPPADLPLWEKIRAHKFAAHLGLTAPRFLLRLPYGTKTDAIDTYPFEEMPGEPVTAGYLWGNGEFAVTYAIGQGFLDTGWKFEPGTDVDDLPCHMAIVDGDKEMTPCAQGWLSDRIGDILHKLGLIPLLSVRNAANIKIAGIHSLAKDGKPLAASWAGGK